MKNNVKAMFLQCLVALLVVVVYGPARALDAASIPTKFNIPFANSAGATYTNVIPEASQIGITNCAASLTTGFPPLTFTPAGAGGCPPFGKDFNGILKQITQWSRWQNAGAAVLYDGTFSTAIGGYPKWSVLAKAATPGCTWTSSVDNNTSNPDTGGANWVANCANLLAIGTTTISGATGVLSNAAGVLAAIATTGSGSVVLGTSPTISNPTISGTISGTPTITGASLVSPTISGLFTLTTPTITNPVITGTVTGSATYASPTISGIMAGNFSLSGIVTFSATLNITPVAFGSLASCVGQEGSLRTVTDSTTATWGATITGGSTNHVLAYCNGTNWTVAGK